MRSCLIILLMVVVAFFMTSSIFAQENEARFDRLALINTQMDQYENTPQENPETLPIEVIKPAESIAYETVTDINPGVKQLLTSRKTHQIDVGVEPTFYRYEEPDIDVKIDGMMMGYYANYTFRPQDSNPLNNRFLNTYMLQGRFAIGDLDYSSGSGIDNGIPNYNLEIRLLTGKDYLLTDQTMVTPYLGFGYRNLEYQGEGRLSSLGFYNYDRHSHYFYIPLGVNVLIPGPIEGWSGEMNAEYDIFIQGRQVSDLSNGTQFTGFENPDIRNYQTSGYGLRGSLKLTYMTSKLNFFVEPFIRFWNIDRSSLASATVDGTFSNEWNEPRNTTTEIGSKFGLQF